MNKAILMGRLTAEPEIRYTAGENNMAIATFSLAVDRKKKGEADFFNFTAFGKQAEFAEKYLHKGTKIVVVGRIQNENYTNKRGEKIYSVRIMVEEMEFAESKAAAKKNEEDESKDEFVRVPEDVSDAGLPFN